MSNVQLLKFDVLFPGRLLKFDVCGLGAILIHRSVLEKLTFRFMKGEPPIFEEFCFGRDCREIGVDIYLDSSLVCGHHSTRNP